MPGLLAEQAPDQALRAWMDLFVDYMVTKRGMADAVIASGGNPYAHSRDMLLSAIGRPTEAGVTAGAIRPDVPAEDIFAGLTGVTLTVGDPARREQARRLLDLLMDGLRHRPVLSPLSLPSGSSRCRAARGGPIARRRPAEKESRTSVDASHFFFLPFFLSFFLSFFFAMTVSLRRRRNDQS